MTLCLVAASRCLRIAVEHLANIGALLVGHHTKIETDRSSISKWCKRVGDKTLNLITHGATSDGEGDGERDALRRNSDIADHVEIDNGTVEFGVLNGAKRLDDLFNGCCGHGDSKGGISTTAIGRIPA